MCGARSLVCLSILVCSAWAQWPESVHADPSTGPAQQLSGIPNELDRTKMYEYLYSKLGYHNKLWMSHAIPLIQGPLVHLYPDKVARSKLHVLDVGCSHGLGVQTLWAEGFCASGVDISPTAVALARKHRKVPTELSCQTRPSFRVGSAGALPWPNGTFDAIISTDVLEHIPTGLVPQMVREMTRVTRGTLLLKIAMQPEFELMRHGEKGDRRRGFVGRLSGAAKQAPTLHETVEDSAWWIRHFEVEGQWSCEDSECEPPMQSKQEWKRGHDSHGRICSSVVMTCTRRT